MPRTPKSTDGEAPKKRTRKAAPATEISTKVVKSKISTTKTPAAPVATMAPPAAPAVQAVKSQAVSEVVVMTSIEERIRIRAYELYLRRGGRGGSPEQDWFQAMAEIYGESVA